LIPCGGIGGRLTLQAVPAREAEPRPGVAQIAAAGLQMCWRRSTPIIARVACAQ
jgi:hypothetical protein